ncbi:MAG TPA: hypothetical protein DIC64_05430 [Alphaproteobacteria bacterium]|nr:hypothetical protein [Alphaproteobacteria bacterium]
MPQDWSCNTFTLHEKDVLSRSANELHNLYQGEYGEYIVEVEAYWQLNSLSDDADCGTSGCTGRMIDMKNNQAEDLRFFCTKVNSENFNQAQCFIHNSEEYLLTAEQNHEYRVKLCGTYDKYVDLKKCDKCFCLIQDSRGEQYVDKMGCTLQSDGRLHCMTGNIYFEKYRPNATATDYEKCIGLEIK